MIGGEAVTPAGVCSCCGVQGSAFNEYIVYGGPRSGGAGHHKRRVMVCTDIPACMSRRAAKRVTR